MDANARAVVADVESAERAVFAALRAGLQEYANGGGRAQPIVDRHFTAGNQQRYGWAPLSREYFLAKQKSLRGNVRGGSFQPGGGRRGSKLDKAAEFQSSTGELVGIGTGKNKPMLVNSGATREAVTSKTARIDIGADGSGSMIFTVPDYAVHLHTGTAKMPKRSPVEPNDADIAAIQDAIARHLDTMLGTGGEVAVSGNTVPGRARTN